MPPRGKKAAGKKTTKKKDPNAPKRSMSSYMYWLADNRETLKESSPGIKNTDLLKLAGEEWKKLKASEKKKYEEIAAEKKEEYLKAKAAYEAKAAPADDEEAEEEDDDE
eukprot:m.32728 g.32728  ORF g.32728 m.32728 type:complete len:109 (-) comp7083_c0_seq1:2341-2667(-)